MEWDSVHSQNYESRAFWDIHWLRSAQSLIASAKELEPKVSELWESYRAHSRDSTLPILPDHYQGTYFMLLAYAVENLFKAAIVRKNSWQFKQKFRADRKFPKELKGHDLVELAQKADFSFDYEEEDLLRRLTRNAVWAGRYPVPLNYRDSSGSERFSNGEEYSVSWFGGKDIKRLNALIERVNSHLGNENA
jgi:hypothetical protein